MGISAKLLVVLAAVAVVGFVLNRDDIERATASHTEIVLSRSSTQANTLASVVLVNNGEIGGQNPCTENPPDPTTECLWVWAKNVDNTTGASAFEIDFTFNSTLARVHSFIDFTTWLASTGRSISCLDQEVEEDPQTGYGHGTATCNSLLPPPPYGATGTGVLAYIALESRGPQVGQFTLDLSNGTQLVDTPPNPDNAVAIPAIVRSINVVVAKCADFTGDGTIRVNDVLAVLGMYQTPAGDLDGSGNTLINDILIAIAQYFADCTQT
jgi:hypothetical protein